MLKDDKTDRKGILEGETKSFFVTGNSYAVRIQVSCAVLRDSFFP